MGEVYTLVTNCDTSVNSAGGAFSPINSSFYRLELTWKDYITMMSTIRRVFKHSGYFWFDTSGYSDKRTAKVPYWFHKLHERYHQLLLCARDGQHKLFEVMMETFAHENRDKGYEEIVELLFTKMSGEAEKQEGGTITAAVGQHGANHTVPFHCCRYCYRSAPGYCNYYRVVRPTNDGERSRQTGQRTTR